MVHAHYIKFPFRILLGGPPQILVISVKIIFWFLDTPGLKLLKSLNINTFGVPYFSVGAGLGYVTYFSLNCYNAIIFSVNYTDELLVQEV